MLPIDHISLAQLLLYLSVSAYGFHLARGREPHEERDVEVFHN